MVFGVITVGIFWGTLFYKLKTTPYNEQQTMLAHSTRLVKKMAKNSLKTLWSRYVSRKNKQREQQKELQISSYTANEPKVITSFRNQKSILEAQNKEKKLKRTKKIEKLNLRIRQMKKKCYKGILDKCKAKQTKIHETKQGPKQTKQTTDQVLVESNSESDHFNKSQIQQLQLQLECENNGGMLLEAMENLEKKNSNKYNPFKSKL